MESLKPSENKKLRRKEISKPERKFSTDHENSTSSKSAKEHEIEMENFQPSAGRLQIMKQKNKPEGNFPPIVKISPTANPTK